MPRDPSSHTAEAWRRIVHPIDYQRMLDIIDAAVETRSAFQIEYHVKNVPP